jgi:hypothetical protein
MRGIGPVDSSSLWSTAPRAVALALGLGFLLRFLKWLVEFTFARLDVSRSALGKRLQHLEAELDDYREATMLMIGVVAKIEPGNPVLVKVAQLLRRTAPHATMDVDELARRLNEIPGRNGGSKP